MYMFEALHGSPHVAMSILLRAPGRQRQSRQSCRSPRRTARILLLAAVLFNVVYLQLSASGCEALPCGYKVQRPIEEGKRPVHTTSTGHINCMTLIWAVSDVQLPDQSN
jgi:hypothetical protein